MYWKHMLEWRYSSTILDIGIKLNVQLHTSAALSVEKLAPVSIALGVRVDLGTVAKRKPFLWRVSNPCSCYTDWATQTPVVEAYRTYYKSHKWRGLTNYGLRGTQDHWQAKIYPLVNLFRSLFLWDASCFVILSHSPNILAIATEALVTLFRSIHNMFRPLRAIFKWNTILHFSKYHQCCNGSVVLWLSPIGASHLISIYNLNFSLN
jgi:hypothetical protein